MKQIRTIHAPDYFNKFTKIKYLRSLLKHFLYSPAFGLWVDEDGDVYVLSGPGLVFIHATPDYDGLDEIMSLIPNDSYIIVPHDEYNEQWGSILEDYWDHVVRYHRYAFSSDDLDADTIREEQKELPDGFELKKLEDEDVKYLDHEMGGLVRKIYGSTHRIFKNTTSYGIIDTEEDVLVAMCMGNPFLEGRDEIDIRTRDDSKYRRKGLGTIAARAFMIHTLEEGKIPDWDAANEISKKMALKLGYTDPVEYLAYSASNNVSE